MVERTRIVGRTTWTSDGLERGTRVVAEETAIAFTYDGTTYAVMMATPDDLTDFAVGFSLTEGIVASRREIESLEIIEEATGVELRMRLTEPRASALAARRRHLAGPVGCGLCGIESLDEAMRTPPVVGASAVITPTTVFDAMAAVQGAQALNRETRSVHAAGFWSPAGGLLALREDVGRHNALDKLAGALARQAVDPADGLLVLTSRLSVELVQKAAMIDVPVVVAVSAPTALAIRTAQAAGITIVAVARDDGFEIFTHSRRIAVRSASHVAS